MIEAKMEEENEKIRRRDWRTGHFSGGEILKGGVMSRSKKVDLTYFIFSFHFLFNLFFNFLVLEQLWLGLISHIVTSVT